MRGDEEMSVVCASPATDSSTGTCHHLLSEPRLQKHWARVSMGNPAQWEVSYFKNSASLSALTTEMYISAAELLP